MQANFDAAITLNIGPFIASIKRAQSEVAKLSTQIDTLNRKTIAPSVSMGRSVAPAVAGPMPSGSGAVMSGSNARTAAASQEIAMQKRLEQAEQQRQKQSASLANQQNTSARSQQTNLARERYALYDVAAAYAMVAAAAAATIVSTAGAAIEYERAFANVDRTTEFTSLKIGAAADAMKESLRSVASEIPVSFKGITEIATIGNQLGIAQGALVQFTETVAKFSATTGVSTEATAMSFGRIGELLEVDAADFEKMGSAIAYAGVNAVATEAQILSVTKEIATTAKMAKFSTPDIIGLSTALSSLGIAPEAARGSVIRTFAGINKAVSEGGDALNKYAEIAGMPAQQFASTWQNDGQAAFDSFLAGLQNLSNQGQNLDSVLRDIGMVNVRDIQTVQKLGDNYDVYTKSLADANKGFKEGTFLSGAYSKIQETMAAKLEILNNNFTNLKATLGEGAVATGVFGFGLKNVVEGLGSLLKELDEFAKSPVGSFVVGLTGILIALATAIAAVNAVMALGRATMLAFATSMGVAKVSADGLTLSVNKATLAGAALNNVMKAGKWIIAISAIIGALSLLADAFTPVEQKASNLLNGFSGLQDALGSDLAAYNEALKEFGGDVTKAQEATGVITGLNGEVENNNSEVNKAVEAHNLLNQFLGITGENASLLSTDVNSLTFVIGENTIAWLKNSIAQSEAFKNLAMNKDGLVALIEAGFNVEDALAAVASGNGDAYFRRLTDAVYQSADGFDLWLIENQQMDDSIKESTSSMGDLGKGLYGVWTLFKALLDSIPNVAKWLGSLVGIDVTPLYDGLMATKNAIEGTVAETLLLGPGTAKAASNAEIYAEQLDEANDSTAGVAKNLRTVVDYANDLRGIFSRAFEIRFGQQESLDEIASGWNNLGKEAEDARKEIDKANASIGELEADKSILEYQLSVAERYGDEKRAAVLRAKLGKINQDLADKQDDLSEANGKLTRSTAGSTASAINNRNALRGQLGSYQALVEMYAKTGLKGDALKAKVNELKEEFIEQGIQAGYSRDDLEPYVDTFDDMREAIEKTPRNVDIEFNSNVSAADQAVTEYLAKLQKASGTFTSKIDVILPQPGSLKMIIDSSDYKLYRMALDKGHLTQKQFYKAVYGIDLNKFAEGGFVSGPGTGTSDSIPALLSNGEYVVKASAVGAYGVDFLNALNQQKVGSFNSSSTMSVSSSGSNVTHLSPEDRALLRAAIDRPVNLYTENGKIAASANAGNVLLAQRGAR